MTPKVLIEKIQALQKLTPSESKIADFFSRHDAKIVFENVSSISQKSGVSKATVVRFISRLGFKNFNEFRDQLRNEIVFGSASIVQRYSLKKMQLSKEHQDVLKQNFSHIINNLQHAQSQIDPDQFLRVAKMIAQPDAKLYIMGQRSSYALAYLFHVFMGRLRSKTTLLGTDASMLPDLMLDVNHNDILLAFFRHPYAKLTLHVAKLFAAQNARIILITDSDFSPLAHLANAQLVVSSEGLSIFHSFTAVTALLESLTIAALQFFEDNIYDRFEKAEKLLADFETFCPGKVLDLNQRRRLKALENGHPRASSKK
jgi:DNA-binding MurR/RpiR family transcriptional regulator